MENLLLLIKLKNPSWTSLGNGDKGTGNYRSCVLRLGLALFAVAGSVLGAYYGFANFGWLGAVIGVVLGYILGMYIFSALFLG